MKPLFITLAVLASFHFTLKGHRCSANTPVENWFVNDQCQLDSCQLFHITNSSSLKRLPSVIRDLSKALIQSDFYKEGFLNKKGVFIELHDTFCTKFDISAAVAYQQGDTVFHINVNRFNKQSSDRALAATLIHEIMHCILLDIDRRGRSGEEKALLLVAQFNQVIKNNLANTSNNFIFLMNREDGQHELMSQLFYRKMVSLLKQFSQIHRQPFWQDEEAEYLMWTGLQTTSAYSKLAPDLQARIEGVILSEKGIYWQ